jgi:hypothetical protein
MERKGRTMGLWAAVGVVALMALVVPAIAATAPASPTPSAGLSSDALSANASATQQWAYGGAKWVNVSLQIGSAAYDSHAFFGWQVIVTATNTSNSTVMLEEQRTMAASLFAQYCAPNCTSPRSSGNLSIRGSETDTGFANLTGSATVYENGSPTAAVGLENAQSHSGANLSESYTLTLANHTASGSLTVRGAAHSQVAFTPALGLVPWNAAPNSTWNSSAAYSASGAWALVYGWTHASLFGTSSNGSGSPSGSVSGNGTVALNGIDLGPVTLANGRTVPVIVLAISGPFDTVDGVILVAHAWAPFGTGVHPFASGALGTEAVTTARLDVALDTVHHRFGVVASASSYSGTDTTLASSASTDAAGPAGTQPTSAATVQGQPESVSAAQQAAGCLTTACTPTHSGSIGGSMAPVLVVGLVVGLVVVAAAGTVGVIEYRAWSRRKSGGQLIGGYSQQVEGAAGTVPRPPTQGPMPPSPPGGRP